MAQGADALWHNAWYRGRRWVYLLLPLSWLFRLIAAARRLWQVRYRQIHLPLPVIIVGNITVGGTGKTPLIIALAEHLQAQGHRPGIVSRGYGGRAPTYPLAVTAQTPVEHSGDEPLAIARATGCPVSVGPDRVAAAKSLCDQGCTVILSDDGLQHYRLGRAMEIAVVDGRRGFGNGFCLPVGPLREPIRRLKSVDWVVVNGRFESQPTVSGFTPPVVEMSIRPRAWCPVAADANAPDQTKPLDHFAPGQEVHAVAGIGHPERFFRTLEQLQLKPVPHAFPDHHAYSPSEFNFEQSLPVVMTAKDAVKCQPFAQPDWWYLAIGAQLPDTFWAQLDERLSATTELTEIDA